MTQQKTFTFDEAVFLIMTFNLGPDYFGCSRDFGIITTHRDEVAEIVQVFLSDWGAPVKLTQPLALVWSPYNSRERIMGMIDSAARSIDIYKEEFRDLAIAEALIAAYGRIRHTGGEVRVINSKITETSQWRG